MKVMPATHASITDETDASYILSMTLTEYKSFRKALTTLLRAGLGREESIGMLLSLHRNKKFRGY